MVWHNYIGKQEEAAGLPGLINGLAGDELDGIALEHWQTIFGDHSDIEGLGIS